MQSGFAFIVSLVAIATGLVSVVHGVPSCNTHLNCNACVGSPDRYCAYVLQNTSRGSSNLVRGSCHLIGGKTYKRFPGNLHAFDSIWAYTSAECPNTNEVLKRTKGRHVLDIGMMDNKYAELWHPIFPITFNFTVDKRSFKKTTGETFCIRQLQRRWDPSYTGSVFDVSPRNGVGLQRLWALQNAKFCADCEKEAALGRCVSPATDACAKRLHDREDALYPTKNKKAHIIHGMILSLDMVFSFLNDAIREVRERHDGEISDKDLMEKLRDSGTYPFDKFTAKGPRSCELNGHTVHFNRYDTFVRLINRYRGYAKACGILADTCDEGNVGALYCTRCGSEECNRVRLPFWYHATNSIRGIVNSNEIRESDTGVLGPGVYVSSNMEMAGFGNGDGDSYGTEGIALGLERDIGYDHVPTKKYRGRVWARIPRPVPSTEWLYIFFNDLRLDECVQAASLVHPWPIIPGSEAAFENMWLSAVRMHVSGGYEDLMGNYLLSRGSHAFRYMPKVMPGEGVVPNHEPRSKVRTWIGAKLWKIKKTARLLRHNAAVTGSMFPVDDHSWNERRRELSWQHGSWLDKLGRTSRDRYAREAKVISGRAGRKDGEWPKSGWCCGCKSDEDAAAVTGGAAHDAVRNSAPVTVTKGGGRYLETTIAL